mgnify:CR=1 FL=1
MLKTQQEESKKSAQEESFEEIKKEEEPSEQEMLQKFIEKELKNLESEEQVEKQAEIAARFD